MSGICLHSEQSHGRALYEATLRSFTTEDMGGVGLLGIGGGFSVGLLSTADSGVWLEAGQAVHAEQIVCHGPVYPQ